MIIVANSVDGYCTQHAPTAYVEDPKARRIEGEPKAVAFVLAMAGGTPVLRTGVRRRNAIEKLKHLPIEWRLKFRSHSVFDRAKRGPASPQRDPPVSGLFFGSSNLLIFDVSRRRGRARRLDVLGTWLLY